MQADGNNSEDAQAKPTKVAGQKKSNGSHTAQGQIIKRGKDTFLVRVYIGRDSQGRRHYFSETVKGSLKDAKKRLTEKIGEKDAGKIIKASRITLNEYLDKWLDSAVSNRVRPNSLHHYKMRMKFQVRPHLGHYRLEAITPMHVQNLITKLNQQGIASTTIKKVHAILSSAFKQAVKWRVLQSNPAEGVEVAREAKDESKKHMRTLTPEQATKFLTSLSGDRYHALFLLAIMGGFRPEEYLGLRWHDINFVEGVVTVRTVLIWKASGGGWYFGEPKTRRSKRNVPLPQSVMDALLEHKRTQDEWKSKAGGGYNDHGLVFSTKSGLPIDQRNLRYSFHRRMEAAGLPSDIRLYDLRHSCASLLLAANVHPKVVSERLGHSSINITLDVYSHVLPTMQEAASEKLEQILTSGTQAAYKNGQKSQAESQ
ncbi:MAG: integrase [Acidobacteriota bacterium]|jgi:integrase|nr:integrase [Acidobacteriota bacterium]